MLILAIDSTQPVGNVTLARADGAHFEIIETAEAHGGKFSAQLVPTVKTLLHDHRLRKDQIDVIAAASGPGTFTGLRVGLAAVKALAEMLGKPVVAVSVLEALARSCDVAKVIAVTEAGKGFWYAGVYEEGGGSEVHVDRSALVALMAEHASASVVTNADVPAVQAAKTTQPVSVLVARVAAVKAAREEFINVDQLDANYVRADEGLYKTS